MIPIRLVTTALASVAFLLQPSQAHSTRRNPVTSVTPIEDIRLQASSRNVNAFSSFDLYFTLHNGNQRIRLALEPNTDVIADDLQVIHLDANGNVRAVEPLERTKHRVYRGKAYTQSSGGKEWVNGGWARITLQRDGDNPIFEGAFRLDGDHHHVLTASNYGKLKHSDDAAHRPPTHTALGDEYMVVWRDSDIMEHYQPRDELRRRDDFGRSSCGSDSLGFNANYKPPWLQSEDSSLSQLSTPSLFGRQMDNVPGGGGAGINLVGSIGSTAGCPKTRKVALLGVAADCTYRSDFDSDQDARANIIQQVNAASAVYEATFNVTLGIQNLTILPPDCPATASNTVPWNVDCSNSVPIERRLSLFSEWRGRSEDTNAFWTLLTKCNTDSAVGLAWLGQVCMQGSRPNEGEGAGTNETISSTNVVVRTETEWQVIAHEIGHTFGAVHDCTNGLCNAGEDRVQKCCPLSANTCDANSRFIMNPSTGRGIENFSPCSIGNVCAAISRMADRCLVNNKGVTTITGQQCGNGIVEGDEECDCGGEQSCAGNSCCDPETCRYTTNSVCDPANEECCTDQCQFAEKGSVCRASTGLCDPEETCSGDSPGCPSDKHLENGKACGEEGEGLQCASGQCTSRDQQCKAMVGGANSVEGVRACEEDSCALRCRTPDLLENQCLIPHQYFLDGTPCGAGGSCENGVCQGQSVFSEASKFFNRHKNVIIPVVSVVGGLVGLAILWCCFSSVRRRMAAKKRRAAAKAGSPAMGNPANSVWQNYGGAFAPQQQGAGALPGGQEASPRGLPPPYPTYQGFQGQGQGQGQWGRSARYA